MGNAFTTTAASAAGSSNPESFETTFHTYDGGGGDKGDVDVHFRLITPPTSTAPGSASNSEIVETSNAQGIGTVTLWTGGYYAVWAGVLGRHIKFTADADSSTGGIPPIVSSDEEE